MNSYDTAQNQGQDHKTGQQHQCNEPSLAAAQREDQALNWRLKIKQDTVAFKDGMQSTCHLTRLQGNYYLVLTFLYCNHSDKIHWI